MKKILAIACLIISILILPGFTHTAQASNGVNILNKSVYETVQKYARGWDQQKPTQVLSTFTADGVYEENEGGFSAANPEEAKKFLEEIFASVPGSNFRILTLTTDGQEAVDLHWEISGFFQGKPYAVQGVDAIQMSGDKINSVRGYSNPEDWKKVFGS
ncbi:MAG: nuclear transport factor 2 family protein [Spirulinaceae cyanobacterium]